MKSWLAASDGQALQRDRITRRDPLISVVIPARNEAVNLTYVLPRIPSMVHEVILVDGHSTDDTVTVARKIRPDIRIVLQQDHGKGDALRLGFEACRGDIIVMLDADGSTDPQEIPRFVNMLLQGADFVKGSRYLEGGGSADITAFRSLGNIALGLLVNTLFGTRYTDLCYGYNAFWRDCLECFEIDCEGFEVETLMNIRAHQSALVIAEAPSYEYQRIHGTSNLNAIRDGIRVLRTVMTEWYASQRNAPKVVKANISASRLDRLEAMPTLELPAVSASIVTAAATVSARAVPARVVAACDDSGQLSLDTTTVTAVLEPPAPRKQQPSVSAIIAAYTEERLPKLTEVIASLQAQTYPLDEIILVIDHNPALHAIAKAAFTGVHVVNNTGQRGLSGARNTGVELATGDLLAFVDDDAIPEPHCIETLVAACSAPAILGVGGHLTPDWQSQRPAWFPDEFGWVVGCSYVGLPERQSRVRNLIGASMLIRRSAFHAVGGFREDMGRVGRTPIGCEETEWCLRAQSSTIGGFFVYEPNAVSRHFVPNQRAGLKYFSARCYHEGISKARVVDYRGAEKGLASERKHALRTLPRGMALGLNDVLRGDATGAQRTAMLTTGLALTVTGYAVGRAMLAVEKTKTWVAEVRSPEPKYPATLADLLDMDKVA